MATLREPKEPAWYNSKLRLYLRVLRGQLGMSIDALSEGAGYSRSTMYAWERGYVAPGSVELITWAEALGYKLCVIPKGPQRKGSRQIRETQEEVAQQ